MTLGGKRTEIRNESKISKSYSSSLESPRSNDNSTSEIKSVSYSSADKTIRYKNVHNSKKSHTIKYFKSPLVVRKDTDSNDSGFRRNSDYSNKHKTKHHRHHHHHRDNFLTSKNSRTEKPNCHKITYAEKNNRGSESSAEEKSRILENEHCRRFSSIEVNGFSDRYTLCNSFNSERNPKDYSMRNSKCNHINEGGNRIKYKEKVKHRVPEFFNLDHNEDKNVSIFSQNVNNEGEKIKESVEGSARTRGFHFKQKEDRKNLQSGRNNNSENTENGNSINLSDDASFLKSCEKINQSRKENNVDDSIQKSFNSKVDKIKKTKKIDNKEIKIANVKEEEILMSISSPATKSSLQTKKSQGRKKSSKGRQKKLKRKEGIQNSNINLNSINDNSERKVENFTNDSEIKNEDKKMREFQEINKKKTRKRKGTRYKNSRPEFKRKTLLYLIRKIMLSDKEEKKNEDRDKKLKISKENSCIRIKPVNKIESSCESSGYDSLKNIQDRLSEIKTQNSNTNFSNYLEPASLKDCANEIEFLDIEKYCVYKIYKNTDGRILLKESQSKEFKKGEYVIGKRILKEPETLLQFMRNTTSEKDLNKLFSHRNNSTQTESNLILSQNSRNKSWFRNSCIKKFQSRSKKYLASLESTSNSNFQESSDFEQLNFTKTKIIHSPSSKKSLSSLPKPPAHFFKKSVAVDTSDLLNFTSSKVSEDKMVLFSNAENEKNLGYFESIKRGKNCSSIPLMIPVSWLKLENSEFIAQKYNVEEMIKVQMENNCNFIQSAEFQIKKPEFLYSEGSSQDRRVKNEEKSSRHFFSIFKRKKYNRIKFENEKHCS